MIFVLWDLLTQSFAEIGCGSPPEVKHGYIVGNYSLLAGSAVHYECEEGFYSNEGKFSYCTANETWEPATLSCKGEKGFKSFLYSSLREFMHEEVCLWKTVDCFLNLRDNFSRSGYLQKKKKRKGQVIKLCHLFCSCSDTFDAGPCIFTDTAMCPSACEPRPRKQLDFCSISWELPTR